MTDGKKRRHQTQIVTAVFEPVIRRDLHPGCLGALGKRLTWISQGEAPDIEFPGQLAWIPVGVEGWPGWVPSQDLVEVERVVMSAL